MPAGVSAGPTALYNSDRLPLVPPSFTVLSLVQSAVGQPAVADVVLDRCVSGLGRLGYPGLGLLVYRMRGPEARRRQQEGMHVAVGADALARGLAEVVDAPR